MFNANNKAVDYLFRALYKPEFDRVQTESMACRIWSVFKEAHIGVAKTGVGARHLSWSVLLSSSEWCPLLERERVEVGDVA
jgi:hypothetical protein